MTNMLHVSTLAIGLLIGPAAVWSQYVFQQACAFNGTSIPGDLVIVGSGARFAAFSPCIRLGQLAAGNSGAPVSPDLAKCRRDSVACIKRDGALINAGMSFQYVEYQDQEEGAVMVLSSVGGDNCPYGGTYRMVVHFRLVAKPSRDFSVEDDDPCVEHVQMCGPQRLHDQPPSTCQRTDYKERCVTPVGNRLLNFQELAKNEDLEIQGVIPEGDRNLSAVFRVSMCRVLRGSTNGAMATMSVEGGAPAAIAQLDSLKVMFDTKTAEVQLRAQIGLGKKRIATDLRLSCDWNATGIKNGKYVKRKSKIYYFTAQSRHACIKRNDLCKITHNDKVHYDLSGTDNPKGYVMSSNQRKVILNVCGELQARDCRNAQVCVDNVNYGSILHAIQIDNNSEFLSATLTGGSQCKENSSLIYSTNIEFVCDLVNRSPQVISNVECVLKIRWLTSHACPKSITYGKHCFVTTHQGDFLNLNGVHSAQDRTMVVSSHPQLQLVYNLCGNISQPCGGTNNVSMCLFGTGNGAKPTVLGIYNNGSVTNTNNAISSTFQGDMCRGEPSIVNVQYKCSYDQPAEGLREIVSIVDRCKYNMTVSTPLACSTPPTYWPDCQLKQDNVLFDLTPLQRNASNYVVSGGSGVRYHISMCRPLVLQPDLLCHPFSLICLENLTIANILTRTSILGSHQKLEYTREGGLVLKFTQGGFCPFGIEGGTRIQFICSREHEDSGPRLKSAVGCDHVFTWRTHHACPTKCDKDVRGCALKMPNGNILYDLALLENRSLVLNFPDHVSFELNLCPFEVQMNKSGSTETYVVEPSLEKNAKSQFFAHFTLASDVEVDLSFSCGQSEQIVPDSANDRGNIYAYKVQGPSFCNKDSVGDADGVAVSTSTSTIMPIVSTKEASVEFVPVDPSKTAHPNEFVYNVTVNQVKIDKAVLALSVDDSENMTQPSVDRSCFVHMHDAVFPLSDLPEFEVFSTKTPHRYRVNLNGNAQCSGQPSIVCRDDKAFSNTSLCPNYKITQAENSIVIMFSSNISSSLSYVNLKCSAVVQIAIVKENRDQVEFDLSTPQWCDFLKKAPVPFAASVESASVMSTGTIVATVLVVALTLSIGTIVYIYRKRIIYSRIDTIPDTPLPMCLKRD